MAEFKTTQEVRNYPISDGTSRDLIALIDAPATIDHLVRATRDDVQIGDPAYVDAMGAMRRGVVVKLTKTKVYVAFTTQGAVDESARSASYGDGYTRGIRVQTTAANVVMIKPAPQVEPVKETQGESNARIMAETVQAQVDADHTLAIVEDHERKLAQIRDEDLTLHSHDGKVVLVSESTETEEPEMTATTETQAENYTGSTVVRLLEKVWARIRENHPELPEVVIITGSGLLAGSKWGHFRAEGWKVSDEPGRKHELFLAGEALAKGANQVLQTMLHEGAHTLSKVRGIQDTSRQGRWHNKEFRKAAVEMGLQHPTETADKTHGYSFVTLTKATKEAYADLLEELDREIKLTCHLPFWLGGAQEEDEKGGEKITGKPVKGEDEEGSKKTTKAVCNCEEPNIIRVSDAVLDKRVIQCDECDSLFHRA